ncbi:hypothetical protein DM860_017578 [Cuscuta australis]|uniref:Lumazine-binding domain-containing protein n=1 Tax=Cuscuta australis TaxID=267555 RepID=A0A328DCZ9_9ASTE|nr:hypothetical protein DM860_017578 [Cuscuta australis]
MIMVLWCCQFGVRSPELRAIVAGSFTGKSSKPPLSFEFHLEDQRESVLEGVGLEDSIAVNDTCLTVTEFDTGSSRFSAGVAPETLWKTSLGELERGSRVNLERALTLSTGMGGHFVHGHVDETREIVGFESEGDSLWVMVKTMKELLRYIVPKGFIAVDGVSTTEYVDIQLHHVKIITPI